MGQNDIILNDISDNSQHSDGTPYVPGDGGILALTVRHDATGALSDDGDYSALQTNDEGRLKTSTMPGMYALVTDTITAIADTVFVDVSRASNIVAQCYGTFSTINCTFEGSVNSTDGSDGNWVTIQAVRTSANTVETTTGNLSAAPAYGWELSVNAFSYVRIRCTARTSGTQTWVLQRGSYATEPIPAIQAHAVTGSGQFTIVGPANDDGVLSGAPLRVGARASYAEPAAMSADNDMVTNWNDRRGRRVVKQQAGTSTVTSVAGSATSVTLKAANTQRLGLTLYNDSTAYAYVKFGATATTADFTVKLDQDSYYEIPYGYTGIVDCIWASATGNMLVTELT